MKPETQKYYPLLVSVIIILLFPALFINLGLPVLSADEGTRAVVALEMEYSGDLITPTINGEPYFNKPPLYNWILLSFFKISGSHSEFIIRLPMIISLILYGFIIFLMTRKYTGRRTAFLSALSFITAGRVLFYDSMLGLIDTTYSLLIFVNFMLIYEFLKKERYLTLFLLSYLITAVTFLMKGLPSLAFQGLTLLAAFIWMKKFRKLISFSHIAGILLFLLITGSYYYFLLKENPTEKYFETLFTESAKRTFLAYGWGKTLINLFTFPFIQLYHLLPWSLLIVFAFRKKFYRQIRENHFLTYLALVFMVNIPVYWISVETYPRYMFMLYPLLLIILMVNYTSSPAGDPLRRGLDRIYFVVLILIIPGLLWGMNYYDFQAKKNFDIVFISLLLSTAIILFFYRRLRMIRPELIIILLLILRIGFNLVVLPERAATSRRQKQKEQAEFVGELTKGRELRLQKMAAISHETSYYISRKRGCTLERFSGDISPGYYYLFYGPDPQIEGEEVIYYFETRWRNSPLRLSYIHFEDN